MELKTELIKIVTCLNTANIDYALCGGLAVAVHGFPRPTKDIDILIREDDLGISRQTLASIGYDLDAGIFKFEQNTDRETRLFRVSKAEGTSLVTLDLRLVTPILRDIWNDREAVEAYGTKIKVVSKASLIKMKELAGRHQDLADAEKLRAISDRSQDESQHE